MLKTIMGDLNDGRPVPDGAVRTTEQGAIVVQDAGGAYFDLLRRGYMHMYSTVAAGIALLVAATTGNHPTIWNPKGSGKLWIPFRLDLGYVAGANAPGPLGLALTENAGSGIAATAPIATFTDAPTLIKNALLGTAADQTVRWAPAVNTYVAAPTWIGTLGISLLTGLAATAVAPFQLSKDFPGLWGLAPGNALSLVAQQATTTATFNATWYAAVIPIPPGTWY